MTVAKRTLFISLLFLACLGFAPVSTHITAVPSTEWLAMTTRQVFLPVVRKGECRTHTASMSLSTTATTLRVGEKVTVTSTLYNQGCVALGLPLHTLWWESQATEPILEALTPLQVIHYLAVAPGNDDQAEFVLQAVGAGQATLRAYTSFEVHLGYPGPAYWASSFAPPLVITVTP